MTYHTPDVDSDRCERDDLPEIGVTPEMVEAGASVIWGAADALGASSSWGCEEGRDWAERVYRAMESVKLGASKA